jgi:hypothetical protein
LHQLNVSRNWVAIPTLVITGTDDNNVPTPNSLIIAGKIPGA